MMEQQQWLVSLNREALLQLRPAISSLPTPSIKVSERFLPTETSPLWLVPLEKAVRLTASVAHPDSEAPQASPSTVLATSTSRITITTPSARFPQICQSQPLAGWLERKGDL